MSSFVSLRVAPKLTTCLTNFSCTSTFMFDENVQKNLKLFVSLPVGLQKSIGAGALKEPTNKMCCRLAPKKVVLEFVAAKTSATNFITKLKFCLAAHHTIKILIFICSKFPRTCDRCQCFHVSARATDVTSHLTRVTLHSA